MGKKGARGGKGGNKFASSFVYKPPKLSEIGREGENDVVNLCVSMLECPAIRIYSDLVPIARTNIGDVKRLILKRHGYAIQRENIEMYLLKADSHLVPKEYIEGTIYELPKHILQGSHDDDEWRTCLNVREIGPGGPTLLDLGIKGAAAPVGGFVPVAEPAKASAESDDGKEAVAPFWHVAIPTVNILYTAIPVRLNPPCLLLESEPWQVDPLAGISTYDPDDAAQRAIFLKSAYAASPGQIKLPARGTGVRAVLDIGHIPYAR
ncbi:Obg domain-containing protein [Pseudoscourfieldia marina]